MIYVDDIHLTVSNRFSAKRPESSLIFAISPLRFETFTRNL